MLEQPCPTCGHLLDINAHICPACGLPRRRIRTARRRTGLFTWFAFPLCALLGALLGWSVGISWPLFGMTTGDAPIIQGTTTLGLLIGLGVGWALTRPRRDD